MAERTREAIEGANERGRIISETQPHTAAARYEAETDRVIVDLTNGTKGGAAEEGGVKVTANVQISR